MADKTQRSKSLREAGDGKKDVSTDRPSRRRALAGVMVAGGSLYAYAAKHTWVKPVIEAVVLPVHAQASGGTGTIAPSFILHGDSDPDARSFGPGDHTIYGIDADDARFTFQANLDPIPDGPDGTQVTLVTDGDNFYDPGDWTDTKDADTNSDGFVQFSDYEVGYFDADAEKAKLKLTFNAPGYIEARIKVTFKPDPE